MAVNLETKSDEFVWGYDFSHSKDSPPLVNKITHG